ncbi:hypothetical protein FRC12_000070 [Ceratobasidium sp. 428]|nr:hypothetical protein FRC12_000070 [Ceratobasidium sp. 428]
MPNTRNSTSLNSTLDKYRQKFNQIKAEASAAFKAPTTSSPQTPPSQSPQVVTMKGLSYRDEPSNGVGHYIGSRIRDHCKYLQTFGIFLSPRKLENTIYECSLAARSPRCHLNEHKLLVARCEARRVEQAGTSDKQAMSGLMVVRKWLAKKLVFGANLEDKD